jgi:hypothetical protein
LKHVAIHSVEAEEAILWRREKAEEAGGNLNGSPTTSESFIWRSAAANYSYSLVVTISVCRH